jgi:hypothetical protein
VSLVRNIVQSFFVTGKSFTYSTILIRGSGEKISGFGGTASGPKILVEGMDSVIKVLQSREGKKLRSIDVLDINNIIGSIVVAGNVRRSAQIAIGDPDDHLYIRAKNWGEGNIPNWRGMSNNSIYADSFTHISRDVWESGYEVDEVTKMAKGEPYGFINLPLSQKYGRLIDGPMKDSKLYPADKDNCEGMNPCLTGDTMVFTSTGFTRLDEVVKNIKDGKNVWVGSYDKNTESVEFSPVEAGEMTRTNANVVELELDDGTSIKLTPDHLVYTENRGYVKTAELTTDDILLKIE